MSYLNVPRIHFGGAFYTGPGTINNIETNYLPDQTLDPVWNPDGVNLFYLQGCRVLSVVDANSQVTDDSSDVLINAAVETPSPQSPSGQFYDIAKLVDLDPDQQGRSAVYGLRIFVTLPGSNAGFSGLMSVPNLRNMNQRVPVQVGSWAYVGALQGTIQDVAWVGDVAQSKLLAAFQAACTHGISVNLMVDLHRNNPAFRGVTGDELCYGRVMGALGPALPAEPEQFVAGRWLESAPSATWSPSPFIVRQEEGSDRQFVSIDLGGAILLDSQPATTAPKAFTSTGHFTINDGIQVGLLAPPTRSLTPRASHDTLPPPTPLPFVPLTNGAISFANDYRPFSTAWKETVCVVNGGIVDIELVGDEAATLANTPLQVALKPAGNGSSWNVVLQERANGCYSNCRETSVRLQQPQSGTVAVEVQFDALQFGLPRQGGDVGLALDVLAFDWSFSASSGWAPQFALSTDLTAQAHTQTDEAGMVTWWLTVTAHDNDINLPEIRKNQDSQVYYLSSTAAAQVNAAVGDNNAFLSVLLWRKFQAPKQPTWADDVGPILTEYAKLYPGMTAILDIGSEATYTAPNSAHNRAKVKARLLASRDDPAYMPLTRDLSDAKVEMIIAWLDQQ